MATELCLGCGPIKATTEDRERAAGVGTDASPGIFRRPGDQQRQCLRSPHLRPDHTLLVHPDGSKESWAFGAKDVEGRIIDVKGEETVKHLPPKAAYDFNCCMLSLIPAALPLAAAKSFIVPGFMPGDKHLHSGCGPASA